jgi:hypothetical protein
MMRIPAGRLAAAIAPLVLVAACATEPPAPVTQNLRMQNRLAPEIAGGRLTVQPTQAGTAIVIPEDSLFLFGSAKLSPSGTATLTYVTQALLEPSILSIGVADPSDSLQGARVRAVTDYFTLHRIGPSLLPTAAPVVVPVGPSGTPVPGLSITVNVVGAV